MMSSDVDINLLHLKLNALEERVKVLENTSKATQFIIPQWDDSLVKQFNDRPVQWPNESYTDYLKRIGEYTEAHTQAEIENPFKEVM